MVRGSNVRMEWDRGFYLSIARTWNGMSRQADIFDVLLTCLAIFVVIMGIAIFKTITSALVVTTIEILVV